MVEADFSGWATKTDLVCADGLTIRPGAFKHMDKQRVPLVWQHQHGSTANVLGHAILEDRAFGTYAYGFFNKTKSAKDAREMLTHGDVNSLSIYANNLTKLNKVYVTHGDIKEVSLVLAGANPGALIEFVNLAHSDADDINNGEAVIFTGEPLEHEDLEGEIVGNQTTQDLIEHAEGDAPSFAEIIDGMTEEQKGAVDWIVEQALVEGAKNDDAEHSGIDEESFLAHIDSTINERFDNLMGHNIFESNGSTPVAEKPTLSHDQLKTILTDAQKPGETLGSSFLSHAAEYGIEDIDFLFPDAKTITSTPDFLSRRTEWVNVVLSGTKHSPFSRIKSIVADITEPEARAKGYVKGNLKKEEVIKLLKRVTTPTTVYKKQKLDRDDIVDITDLDVVAWLKAEMRLMLDEEIARAILIGDGREPDDEDKINEDNLRPIAFDDDMYAHKHNLASTASPAELEEGILRSRVFYKGTGTPTFFTTDQILTDLLLNKDKMGRRYYANVTDLAAALRVDKIVVVEVMEDIPDLLGIVVNLADYTIGADRGGQLAMFDDFDIDYNQYKYLIESRISGTLTKPKSAVVIRRAAGTSVTPDIPSYNSTTHVIAIPSKTGVVYKINGSTVTGNVTITETTEVEAVPATGYSFPHNIDTDWSYSYTA